jgi:hypothetical protein
MGRPYTGSDGFGQILRETPWQGQEARDGEESKPEMTDIWRFWMGLQIVCKKPWFARILQDAIWLAQIHSTARRHMVCIDSHYCKQGCMVYTDSYYCKNAWLAQIHSTHGWHGFILLQEGIWFAQISFYCKRPWGAQIHSTARRHMVCIDSCYCKKAYSLHRFILLYCKKAYGLHRFILLQEGMAGTDSFYCKKPYGLHRFILVQEGTWLAQIHCTARRHMVGTDSFYCKQETIWFA